MKKLYLSLAFVVIASSAFAQVGALRINQQTGPQSGQRVERLVVPSASDALGFDANKKLVRIATSGTGNIQRVSGAAVTPASVASTGPVTSSSATGGVGYATGAGSTVTQGTDKTTTVVINTPTGSITTVNTSMSAGAETGFTVTNSSVAATDIPIVVIKSGGTLNSYSIQVDAVAAGSFHINITNLSAGSLAEALVLNFAIIKGVSS